jgi:hypothetical protein
MIGLVPFALAALESCRQNQQLKGPRDRVWIIYLIVILITYLSVLGIDQNPVETMATSNGSDDGRSRKSEQSVDSQLVCFIVTHVSQNPMAGSFLSRVFFK